MLVVGYDRRLVELAPAVADANRLRVLDKGPGLTVTPQLLDLVGVPSDGSEGLTIVSAGREHRLPIAALTSAELGATLNGGRVIAMPLGLAQAVSAKPLRVSSILVRAVDRSPSSVSALRDALQHELGDRVEVVTADRTLRELETTTRQLRATTAFLSLFVLLLGAYVVFSTISMADRKSVV